MHTDSANVRTFAENAGVEPQVQINVHLAEDIITVGLFDEKFLLNLLRECKVETAPELDDSVLLSYLYFSSGFNSKIVDLVFNHQPAEVDSDSTPGCDSGITIADIELISQTEVED
ncbi:hypothetical protein [Moorena sp. SIO3I8]|uniref:hypothetical protein n=1 Tax=Moorena sp. SIO3I8 TaxID=2607833 RepID=UPI0013C2156D|nr:hypothetical protein [Moorena sp. SIO3I8]NEO08443.1 hypothetical protein [Moorena sp. SIO3I8]